MKKYIFFAVHALVVFTLFGCVNNFNQVYKSSDISYKYEFAKEYFVRGKYTQAVFLLQDVVLAMKGTANSQESLYLLAVAEYNSKEYEGAMQFFQKYYITYPKGTYAEECAYFIGESLYQGTPETQLDQSSTFTAMEAYQTYLEAFPGGKYEEQAQQRLIDLQEKIIRKEYYSAKLYFNLGSYFGNCTSGGNNYEACIITSQNAIKDFPYSNLREDFAILIMKSKFQLAEQSIESKQLERYRDAEDECYGFINEYPDSDERKLAERYIEICKKHTRD